jgi:hypothetical protein
MDDWSLHDVLNNPNQKRSDEQHLWIQFFEILSARLSLCKINAKFQGRTVMIVISNGIHLLFRTLDRRLIYFHSDVEIFAEAMAETLYEEWEQKMTDATKMLGESATQEVEVSERARAFAEEVEKRLLGK